MKNIITFLLLFLSTFTAYLQAMELARILAAPAQLSSDFSELACLATAAASVPTDKSQQIIDLPRWHLITAEELQSPRKHSNQKKAVADTQQNKYPCPYPGCSKKYTLKFPLKKHILTHLDLKLYKCTVAANCKKSYQNKLSLQYHLENTHRDKPGLKAQNLSKEDRKKLEEAQARLLLFDFICGKCDRSFETQQALVHHNCRNLLKIDPSKSS